MFADLADEPHFVAIKESSENVRRMTDLKNACGDRYLLFCGVDDLVLECAADLLVNRKRLSGNTLPVAKRFHSAKSAFNHLTA